MLRHSKVIAQTDRQTETDTHRQYGNITFPHTRAVKANLSRLGYKLKQNRLMLRKRTSSSFNDRKTSSWSLL